MGLFSKKYDFENDSLQQKYNLETDEFYFTKAGQIIDKKQLNFKSRRLLKKKNKMTEQERIRQRVLAQHEKIKMEELKRRNIAREARIYTGWPDLPYDSFEVLSGNGFESRYSSKVKEYLENLTCAKNNAEYIVGIHRIGDSEEYLENIFNQGIIVQGHQIGAAKGTPELKNTVSYYPENSTIMKEVAYANQYKASRGSIVVKIPKEDIIANNIYSVDDERKNMYLNPKYILGYFPIEEDKTVSQIVTKDTLHIYEKKRREEAERYISMGNKVVNDQALEKNKIGGNK